VKTLRNIPGLVKRHYEKVILALALLVLIGAVVYLNQMKNAENEKIETYEKGTLKRKPKPVQVVDLSVLSSAMSHATNPPALNFSPPHNLFNPVKWQQDRDGRRIKAETGTELGINAMQITAIAPLRTLITLDSQAGSGLNMSITQEASTNRYFRQRLPAYLTTNTPSERIHRTSRGAFTLKDLRLPPEGAEADIELADGTKLTVTASKPFSRIEGYKADLFYPPEKQSFKERRVGDAFTVAGEDYNIVAITPNEVVVSARSNDRRTIIRSNAP
jgi:hypothetical protein